MPPAAIEALSDSESSAESCRGVKRKAEVKREAARPRFKFHDDLGVQAMLAKPCGSAKCKRRCKEWFRKKEPLAALMQFRRKWGEFHKLDRDRMAPCLVSSGYFAFGQRSVMFSLMQGFWCNPRPGPGAWSWGQADYFLEIYGPSSLPPNMEEFTWPWHFSSFKHSCFSSTCCGTGLAWYPPFYDYSDQCSSCLMTLLSDCEALEGSTKSWQQSNLATVRLLWTFDTWSFGSWTTAETWRLSRMLYPSYRRFIQA